MNVAATERGSRLTEAHRQAQADVAAAVVRQMGPVYRLLDPFDLDATADRWVRAALPIVRVGHRASSRLAAAYISAFRLVEAGALPEAPPVLATIASQAVVTSLRVTGPIVMKEATGRGVDVRRAFQTARVTSSAAAMRHALDGGRTTTFDAVDADPAARGWARVASFNCCAFCSMLASRGASYRSEGRAGFDPHDSCKCTVEPIYRPDAAPTNHEYHRDRYQAAQAAGRDTVPSVNGRALQRDGLNNLRRHIYAGR